VLLGGSGSGKTTLRGRWVFRPARVGLDHSDGADLARMPPHRRPVNTVFQSGACSRTSRSAANIGFGPRQRGWACRRAARVTELLALVRLEGYGTRRRTNSPAASSSGSRWPRLAAEPFVAAAG